jgi:crossover junction endodeoxyribonuclease RuvC
MIVLGIDPGSVRVGFGLIKRRGAQFFYLASGLFKISTTETGRLVTLERELRGLIKKFCPDLAAVEKLFFAKNKKTALRVAEARGVIINTVIKCSLPVVEIAPTEAKLAVAGSGGASKEAVAKMVRLILKVPADKNVVDDVTDALAIAIAASGWRGVDN